MRSNARSLIAAILAALGILLSGSPLLADGFSVDFGAETRAGKDAGSVVCGFEEPCVAKMESLGLRLTINIFRSERQRAYVHLYGRDHIDCCYFEAASDSIVIDPRQALSRVPFFRGRRARGELFIENERVGTLYLRFYYH
jgi:hypothetical protein